MDFALSNLSRKVVMDITEKYSQKKTIKKSISGMRAPSGSRVFRNEYVVRHPPRRLKKGCRSGLLGAGAGTAGLMLGTSGPPAVP